MKMSVRFKLACRQCDWKTSMDERIWSSHILPRLLLIVFVGLTSVGCEKSPGPATGSAIATSADNPDAVMQRVDAVLDLMRARLALMQDVARWKWNSGKPVHDPQREVELLERLTGQAQDAGLDTEFARDFFQSQMQASKIIQQAAFEAWQADGSKRFADVPDLQTELRPKIGDISHRLVTELAALQEELSSADVQQRIRSSHLDSTSTEDSPVWNEAIAPLLAIPAKPN